MSDNLSEASVWIPGKHGKDHLEKCLQFAVPLWVNEHRNKSTEWLMRRKDNIRMPKEFQGKHSDPIRSISSIIGERGDRLMYGGKTGEAGFLFNCLAEGLAILSIICKGGVDFGDLHFEFPHKDLENAVSELQEKQN